MIEGHFHGTQTTYTIETLGHRLEAIELGTVPRFLAADTIRVDYPWIEGEARSLAAVWNSMVSAVSPGPNDIAQPVRPRAPEPSSFSITNMTVADDMLP